jgi:uroporphyrinogen-III synthase
VTSPLAGRRVIVTRERPGELATKLEARGAVVVHVPLIAIADPPDGGVALRDALGQLERFDWLIVTSAVGASRVAGAARSSSVRLAAVGTATAAALAAGASRPVDLVPSEQRGAALAAAFVERHASPQRVLVARAERANADLVTGLRAAGHDVTEVDAYRTVARVPDEGDRVAVATADAVAFASGSAVESWAAAFGAELPVVAVAIGPTTAAVAAARGLKISSVAADHSLDGLVTELERQCAPAASADADRADGTRMPHS